MSKSRVRTIVVREAAGGYGRPTARFEEHLLTDQHRHERAPEIPFSVRLFDIDRLGRNRVESD